MTGILPIRKYGRHSCAQPVRRALGRGPRDLAQIRERDYPAALAGLSGECVLVGITYRESTDEYERKIERINL